MVTLIENPQFSSGRSPRAVLLTREDCLRLEQNGSLQEPYELVEGVVNFMGQNIRHGSAVRLLIHWLFAVFGLEYVVTQVSIDVHPEDNPTSESMPDLLVLAHPVDTYTRNPRPEEIRLLIEVSDTTLTYDRVAKAGLYARAGIPEYWIVSLPERAIHIYRTPQDGTYQHITTHAETEQVTPLAAPTSSVAVSQLLPGVQAHSHD